MGVRNQVKRRSRRLFAALCVASLAHVPGGISAAEVDGLYEAVVPVADREPASREQAVARALPQAFASLSIEPEERRRELADQLRNAPSSVDAVGEGWSLRDNVYTDFTHGLRWQAPTGTMFSAAVRASLKNTSLNSASPVIWTMGRISTPSWSMGIRM